MNHKESYYWMEANLYNLYSKAVDAIPGNIPSCKAFKTNDSAWPNYVAGPSFNTPLTEEIIDSVKREMESGNWPSFWIRQNINISSTRPEIDPAAGIRHIMRWPGMIARPEKCSPALPEGVSIDYASTEKQIAAWHSIVNQVLFRNPPLSLHILQKLASDDSIILYTGYYQGEPAATILVNYFQDSCGMYMGSCLPQFRKKGIISSILQSIKKDAYQRGSSIITLQANKESFPLYQKLGYSHVSHFDIYWMLPRK